MSVELNSKRSTGINKSAPDSAFHMNRLEPTHAVYALMLNLNSLACIHDVGDLELVVHVDRSDQALDALALYSAQTTHILAILGSAGANHVVGNDEGARANHALLQVQLELRQIELLDVIEEQHVNASELALGLHLGDGIGAGTNHDGDHALEASHGDKLGSNVGTERIRLDAPHMAVGSLLFDRICGEQGRVSQIAAELNVCCHLLFSNHISEEFGLLVADADKEIFLETELVHQIEQFLCPDGELFAGDTSLDVLQQTTLTAIMGLDFCFHRSFEARKMVEIGFGSHVGRRGEGSERES